MAENCDSNTLADAHRYRQIKTILRKHGFPCNDENHILINLDAWLTQLNFLAKDNQNA